MTIAGKILFEKSTKMTPYYKKMVVKKVPLLPKSDKKDTLSSDLCRSEPHSEKGTQLF